VLPINVLDSKAYQAEQLLQFHSGCIAGLLASAYTNEVVTAGADGTIRALDSR
jgi:hypothetical protein